MKSTDYPIIRTHVIYMVNIFGYELDIVSFIPALFGVLLSLYNWYLARRPANIHPSEFYEYGVISSSYYERILFCLPLIFHNEGKKKGMIKRIKVGFKHGDEIRYIDIDGKARLNELSSSKSDSIGWDDFQRDGYQFIKPTYPIIVEPDQSTDVVLISEVAKEDDIIPLDEHSTCIIEVYFRKNKMNKVEIPFYLSKDYIGEDEDLLWLNPAPPIDEDSENDEHKDEE